MIKGPTVIKITDILVIFFSTVGKQEEINMRCSGCLLIGGGRVVTVNSMGTIDPTFTPYLRIPN